MAFLIIAPLLLCAVAAAALAASGVAIDATRDLIEAFRDRSDASRHDRHPSSVVLRPAALLLSVVGAYYLFLGIFTLVNLPGVTNRWIELSGDSDFKWDFGLFLICIGVGAAIVTALGIATTASGLLTAAGRQMTVGHWTVLAVVAPFVHFPWFVYRVIATGHMASRSEAGEAIRLFAIRCAAVCVLYALVWLLTRRRTATASAA